MTFELEISTMHKDINQCFKMLEDMNIHCDCLIINQCDIDDYFEGIRNGNKLRIFFTKERGLSKSRNMALKNCNADILGIADDDLLYYDNFDKTIIKVYEIKTNASAICFNIDNYSTTFSEKDYKCKFRNLFSFKSVMCTFKVNDLRTNNLTFNEYFGTGSSFFQSGEENIMLANIYNKGLLVYYNACKILKRSETESSWFHGFDEDFIKTRGAITYAMAQRCSFFWILLFAVKKTFSFRPFNFLQIVYFMFYGRRKYMQLIKNKKNGNDNRKLNKTV